MGRIFSLVFLVILLMNLVDCFKIEIQKRYTECISEHVDNEGQPLAVGEEFLIEAAVIILDHHGNENTNSRRSINIFGYNSANKLSFEEKNVYRDAQPSFVSTETGYFHVCFSNPHDEVISVEIPYMNVDRILQGGEKEATHRSTQYNILNQDHTQAHIAQASKNQLQRTNELLQTIVNEQYYLEYRVDRQLKTQKTLHSRAVWWPIISFFTLVAVTVLQVVTMNYFFTESNRRAAPSRSNFYRGSSLRV